MPNDRIAILFDIDGTLLITGGAGAASWLLAFDELYGIPADIGKFTDTGMTERQMEKIDIPPVPEFVELVGDSGAHLYACKATVDMFGLTMDDFVPQVDEIISVGEFYEKAAGGQIIFT
jgi:peroxiredoxin family protein